MKYLATMAVLAACGGDGVTLEVFVGDSGATTVDVFIADAACTSSACDRMSTATSQKYLDGAVYTRDDASRVSLEVRGGKATIRLQPRDADDKMLLLYVAGLDAEGTIVGGSFVGEGLDVTGFARLQTTLGKIDKPFLTGDRQGETDRAELWTTGDGQQCLGFEVWNSGADAPLRKFIVPADDLDCDQVPDDVECDTLWPDKPAGSTTTGVCLGKASGNECVFGGRACIEGEGPQTCVPDPAEHQCVPGYLCGASPGGCADDDSEACRAQALYERPLTGNDLFIDCLANVYAASGAANTPCQPQTAVSSSVGLSTAGMFPANTCRGVPQLALLELSTIGAFADRVTVDSLGGELLVTAQPDSCDSTFLFQPPYPMDQSSRFIMKVTLQNDHAVWIPVLFHRTKHAALCENETNLTCTLRGADAALMACAMSDDL